MALSIDVLQDFVKNLPTSDSKNVGDTLNGTIKGHGGKLYVQLDGSDQLTPYESTVTGLSEGDRVLVTIKAHKATITGNTSNPSATKADTDDLGNKIVEVNTLLAEKVSAEQIEADLANVDKLLADEATIDKIKAGEITVKDVLADAVEAGTISAASATIVNMGVDSATITNLVADYLTAKDLEADSAKFNNVKTIFAKVEQLAAVNIDVDNLDAKVITTETLGVDSATIDELGVDKAVMNTLDARYIKADSIDAGVITTDNLDANVAKIVNAEVENATIEALDTKYARMETVEANYANINLANITDAALDNLYAKTGIIKDMTVEDGTVTGTLGAININADNITAGTMKADRLLIQGEDGLYYRLNTNGVDITGEQTNENSLNGKVILAKSIVADQISVSDLVAFGAKIAGMNLEEGRLYSMAKSEVGATTEGFYMDEEGQFAVGGGDDYIRYVKQSDGTYKLDINASSLNITVADGTNKSILRHTADGFVFDMSSVMDVIDANKDAANAATDVLNNAVSQLNAKTGWIRFGTTNLNDGQQGLILGSEDKDAGDITLQLVNNQLAFVQDGQAVAYITDNLFHIRQGVLTEELHLGEQTDTTGSWVWKKRASEHLGLRYQASTAALVVN